MTKAEKYIDEALIALANTEEVIDMPLATDDQSPINNQKKQAAEFLRAISRLENLLQTKCYHPGRVWRSFFKKNVRRFGGWKNVITLLSFWGPQDFEVIEYLRLAEYSSIEIVKILEAAGWDLERISYALIEVRDQLGKGWDQSEQVAFILSCGKDDAWIIFAISCGDLLYHWTIDFLLRNYWEPKRFLAALIKAECFTPEVYQTLMSMPSAAGKTDLLWSDEKLLILMEQLGISDCQKYKLFFEAGKPHYILMKFLLSRDWDFSRIFKAVIEAKVPIGDLAAALNIIEIPRGEIIKLISALGPLAGRNQLTDAEIMTELTVQEWPINIIIDACLDAGWEIERIIRALAAAGYNDFSIGRAIREGAEYYGPTLTSSDKFFDLFGLPRNLYWSPKIAKIWRKKLAEVFPTQELLKAL